MARFGKQKKTRMVKKLKAGSFIGSFYLRQKMKDKHGNTYKSVPTYREVHQGIVVDKNGNFLGYEKPHQHKYGKDFRKAKRPKGWHGENIRHSLARKGIKTR